MGSELAGSNGHRLVHARRRWERSFTLPHEVGEGYATASYKDQIPELRPRSNHHWPRPRSNHRAGTPVSYETPPPDDSTDDRPT